MSVRRDQKQTVHSTLPVPGLRLWWVLALCCSWAAVPAAAADPRLVTLPIVDGSDVWFTRPAWETLSHTRVTHVVQDDLGFIWFGTMDGLRRYDGVRFKQFRPKPWAPNSLRGANIETLFKGSDGHLWIASDHFLDRFDPVTEAFTQYPSGPGGIEGQVYDISQDRAGAIWLATDHGLVKLDPITGTTIRYEHRPDDSSSLSSDIVRASLETRDGSFWVATTRGVDVFDRRAGRVTRRIPVQVGVENALMTLFEDHRGALWVTYSSGNGLATIDRSAYAVTYYSTDEREPDPSQLTGVEAILEDGDGTLWIGTQGRGILRLDADRQRFVRYRNRPDDIRSVSDDFVYCLFADRERQIWAGTSGAGLNRFSPEPLPFRTYRHNRSNAQSLARSLVESVMEDSAGTLWVGTKGVLNRIARGRDGRLDQYTAYDASDRSLGIVSSNVMSMAEDASGHLWFGTFGGGLNRFDPKTRRFKVYRHDPSDPRSLADDVVTSLYVDRKGALWAGSDTGISRFDPRSDGFDVYRIDSPLVSQYHVIDEDPDGNLWLASWQGGLQRFDPGTGTFALYPYHAGGQGISSDWVNTVHVDRDGMVWAGTQAGLNRLDPRTGEFALFTESEGLSNNGVMGILEDREGNLWLATNNGLNKFDPRSGRVVHFFASDGIAANEFSRYGTAFQSSTGEMFFGSYGGVTAFFPGQVREPSAPDLVLTELRVDGQPVSAGPDSPLSRSISHSHSITLDPAQDTFSIEFAALAFAGHEGIRFRHRLRGVEVDWLETDSSRPLASYTNLSPGRYVLEVQVTNLPRVWPRPATELEIVVLPPWWSTWWFRVLVGLAAITLIAQGHRLRLSRVQQQEKMLRDTIETIPSVAWISRPDGSNEFVNRRWMEYTGLLANDTTASGWQGVVHSDNLPSLLTRWHSSLASGEPFEDEARFRAADGAYRWFLVRAVPLRDERDRILRWYGVMTDIEDRKRTEQERERIRQLQADLAHVNRVSMLGQLAASLSHELKQPVLGAALNAEVALQTLASERPDLNRVRKALQLISTEGTRAGELIDRLRSLYRKGTPLKRAPVDVNAVARDMLPLLHGEATVHGVSVRLDLQEPLAIAFVDRVQLQQVLMNLMLNGIEAMRHLGGTLTVTTRGDHSHVEVSVSDSGIGLPPGGTDVLFSPFFSTKAEGSGMGLAISRSIVEAHDGRLWATSNPEQGATFHFTLPACVGLRPLVSSAESAAVVTAPPE